MAEETQPAAAAPEEVVVAEAVADEPVKEDAKPQGETEVEVASAGAAIGGSTSFKEESNLVADLADPEKKALEELKQLVTAAIAADGFKLPPPPPPPQPAASAPVEEPKAEETKAEEPKTEAEGEAAAEAPAEPKVTEPEAEAPAESSEPAAEPEAEEKTVIVVTEDDGAKTVEAIEETVVPVEAAEAEAAPVATEETAATEPKDVSIWGIPLLSDERSDTVLLKFLRAREFKPKEAMAMLKSAVLWRESFDIEQLLETDLELSELEKAFFYCNSDREGHPVCYNVYGEFGSKDLYEKAFGDDEKRGAFLKWRIQLLEKGIRSKLDFTPGAICSMVQVTDLKNSPPLLGKHRTVTRQAVVLFQDNYPEFIAKKVFINVPWWYLAVNRMMSPFLTQRTKSKFVFAGPSKSAETLFKYIAPEQVPVQFGGLFKEDDTDFSISDAVTELTIKPASKETIEIPVTEISTVVWELRVIGWDVSYGAEFTPSSEGGYTVIVQKTRKVTVNDEPVMKGSFKIGEAGKVVLIIENPTSKKKKLLYRSKVISSAESM